MECGVPFCMSGCPLGNLIPHFNDLIFKQKWVEALETLHSTNNFPEFTGMICPAPCESSCVLGITKMPVAIKHSEVSIVQKGFELGLIKAKKIKEESGYRVAIIGSGPAGLACAQQLRRAGQVTVFDRAPQAGGLLMYGIPHYKLPKEVVQRRVNLLKEEGVKFILNCEVGESVKYSQLKEDYDALVIAIGAEKPRDLPIPGRKFKGVHFAMDFLPQQVSKIVKEKRWNFPREISAKDKNVIIIGGGDTGSDCIGTSLRQKAKTVDSFEIIPKPPENRSGSNPWPQYARVYSVSSSMEESFRKGGEKVFSIKTIEFVGNKGKLTAIKTIQIEWKKENGSFIPVEIPGTERLWPCQLALLAIGYVSPKTELLEEQLGIALDQRGNIHSDEKTRMTNINGVFAAGDCRRGQSLVVWAIAEGREIAKKVDQHLNENQSFLKSPGLKNYAY